MMPPSRLDCPLSLETANMGNTGLDTPIWRSVRSVGIFGLFLLFSLSCAQPQDPTPTPSTEPVWEKSTDIQFNEEDITVYYFPVLATVNPKMAAESIAPVQYPLYYRAVDGPYNMRAMKLENWLRTPVNYWAIIDQGRDSDIYAIECRARVFTPKAVELYDCNPLDEQEPWILEVME